MSKVFSDIMTEKRCITIKIDLSLNYLMCNVRNMIRSRVVPPNKTNFGSGLLIRKTMSSQSRWSYNQVKNNFEIQGFLS